MEKIFSAQKVKELNELQNDPQFHGYTCCGDGIEECLRSNSYERRRQGEQVPYTAENEGKLTATEEGWICPCGKYKQNWAH